MDPGNEVREERRVKRGLHGLGLSCPDESRLPSQNQPHGSWSHSGPPLAHVPVIFSTGMCRTCHREIEWKI